MIQAMEYTKHKTPVELRKVLKESEYMLVKIENEYLLTVGCIINSWKDYMLVLKYTENIKNTSILSEFENKIHSENSDSIRNELNTNIIYMRCKTRQEIKEYQEGLQILPKYLVVFKFNKKLNEWKICKRHKQENPSQEYVYIFSEKYNDIEIRIKN